MRIDLTEIGPSLLALRDQDLRVLVGERSFTRGHAFAQSGRVSGWQVTGPHELSAAVRGETGVYRSQVVLHRDGQVLGGDCTCPLGGDCKHVVAVALAARSLARRATPLDADQVGGARSGASGQRRAAPAWEQVLGPIVAAPQPQTDTAALGLLLEARDDTAPAARVTVPAVRMRPVVPGKNGWVRTGVSWSTLAFGGYGSPRLDPAQVAALQRLLQTRAGYSRYEREPDWLTLDALDEGWLPLLRRCRQVGIALLTAQRGGGAVILAEQPAQMVFDLVRDGEDLVLTPGLALSAELLQRPGPPPRWSMVGQPPHGLVARSGPDLLVAHFAERLDHASAQVLRHGSVHVPAADVDRFLRTGLPALLRRFSVTSHDDSVPIEQAAPPLLRLTLTHGPGVQLALHWQFVYRSGDDALTLSIDSGEHLVVRDRTAEAALLAALDSAGLSLVAEPALPGLPARLLGHTELSGWDVVQFLDQTLPQLVAAMPELEVVHEGEQVAYTQADSPAQVHLSLTASPQERDWFDLDVEVRVGQEQVPLASLIGALARGDHQLVLPTGTWFRIDRPELDDLRRLLEEARALQERPDGPLRLSAYQADLWAELEALGIVEEQADQWASVVRGMTGQAPEPLAAPPALQATLRPYQQQGFEWLTFLRRHGLGGVLADDMGLGKTVQMLSLILQERHDTTAATSHAAGAPDAAAQLPWLVVAPTSVLTAWTQEAARFAPQLRVRAAGETSGRRGTPVAQLAQDADLVLTSYAVLRLDDEQFGAVAWAGVVLDEAQHVKNHQSATYQAVRRLTAGCRFAVTGTPMENNLMELWSLLSITAPGLFPSPKVFAEYYRRPIESGETPERLDTLRRRIRPIMLRRTKQQVATELPPKQEQVVRVELSTRHRSIYERVLARERQRVLGLLDDPNRNRIAIFRSLTVLRQLSLHPVLVAPEHESVACAKIDALLEVLLPVVAEGHQAIVFSQFTSFLRIVRARLEAEGVSFAYLDGRTRKRAEAVEQFRSGASPVFLVSLKAGGSGLTLTEADYVFLLDPWWNPAVEAQAVDRAHRIGQGKSVHVYRLVSAETIEEKVLALQERKRELFASVVDEGAFSSGALTSADIRALVD